MSDSPKRFLNELRVIDLRAELEKRNLDKSGVRGVLLKRLAKHLEEEGEDPEKFKFELAADVKTSSKRQSRSASTIEPEPEEAPLDVNVEDMIVQDDAGDDDDTEEKQESNDNLIKNGSEKLETTDSQNRKRELNDKDETETEVKKPCLDKADLKQDDENKELNNTDAEDSINLDLGEDELLNDEADNPSKGKKDDAGTAEEEQETSGGASAADPDSNDQQDKNATQANTEANTTSDGNDEQKDKDQKEDKEGKDGADKKDGKEEGKEGAGAGARNLWVSGLSGDTRAKDLKQLCSKHGKVIGAKVVTNARTPGSRCYGYVTMASAQDAESCIKNLHRTELHGRMISVEKAKSEGSAPSSQRRPTGPSRRDTAEKTEEGKTENGESKEGEKDGETKPKKEGEPGAEVRSSSRTRERSHRSDRERVQVRRDRSRERRRSPREVLSFSKIWKERDAARARERSRAAREEERRRRAAEEALRERERRQRQEKHRLELEREKLRQERERIEREKNELLRLERERHKLEREKLELERLELKRAQLRLEEERRKRSGYDSSSYRKAPSPPPPPPPSYDRDSRHKRPPQPPLSSGRSNFEAPPPPRFEMSAPAYDRSRDKGDRDRDYKRADYPPRHVSSSNIKYPSNGAGGDDARQPLPPGTRPKEPSRSGYEGRDAPRGYRSPPPTKAEPRAWPASTRYPDPQLNTKGKGGNSGGDTWSSSGGAGDNRYGGTNTYETRSYPQAYQPPPPGAGPYPDRYNQPNRDYRPKY